VFVICSQGLCKTQEKQMEQEALQKIEQALGLELSNRDILTKALTHSSAVKAI
jgi:dsRNA-specific ribonuclease